MALGQHVAELAARIILGRVAEVRRALDARGLRNRVHAVLAVGAEFDRRTLRVDRDPSEVLEGDQAVVVIWGLAEARLVEG